MSQKCKHEWQADEEISTFLATRFRCQLCKVVGYCNQLKSMVTKRKLLNIIPYVCYEKGCDLLASHLFTHGVGLKKGLCAKHHGWMEMEDAP